MSNYLIPIELLIRELEKMKDESEWAPVPLHLELELPREEDDVVVNDSRKTVIIIDI